MVKRVFPAYVRFSGVLTVPRAERSHGVNLAARGGIGEDGVVGPDAVRSKVAEYHVLQSEHPRIFVRLVGADHQLRIVAHDRIHAYLHFPQVPPVGACLITHGCGRNVDDNSAHMDRSDVSWSEDESGQRGVEVELSYGNDGLPIAGGHYLVSGKNPQASAGNVDAVHD